MVPQEEVEFSDEEQLATVTIVEDFDIQDPTGTFKADSALSNTDPSPTEALADSKSKSIPAKSPRSKPTASKAVKAAKPAKAKFHYETKAARTHEKKKQKMRRNEKGRLAEGREKGGRGSKRR